MAPSHLRKQPDNLLQCQKELQMRLLLFEYSQSLVYTPLLFVQDMLRLQDRDRNPPASLVGYEYLPELLKPQIQTY